MKILTIKLKNFGIINEESLSFGDGLFVFSGDNGEGKSTFLKAISLILFNKSVGKMTDYIQWGKDKAEVQCNFTHNGIQYYTELILSEKGTSRLLSFNDIVITSTSGVTEKLDEILDIKRALISTTSFEHEIDLINTSPSERREYLKRVYDLNFKGQLEKIDSAIKSLEENSIKVLSKKDSLSKIVYDYQVIDRLPFTKEKFDEKKKQLSIFESSISSMNSLILKYEEDLKLISEKKEEISNLKSDLEKKEEKLKTLASDKNSLLEKSKSFETFEYKDELSSEIQAANNLLEQFIKDKKKIELEIESIKFVNFKEEELLEKENILKDFENKIYNLKEKIELSEKGQCPTCGHLFDSSEINSFTEELQKLTTEKLESEGVILALKYLKESNEESKKLKEKKESEILTKNIFIKNTEESISKTKSILEKDKAEKLKLWEENKKENTLAIEKINKEIKDLEEEISTISKNLENKNLSLKDESSIKEQIEKKKLEVSILEKENNSIKEDIEKYNSIETSNNLKIDINEKLKLKEEEDKLLIANLEKEYNDDQEQLEINKLSKKILSKDFPSFVLSKLIKNIECFTNEFIQNVYPKYTLKFVEEKNSLGVVYSDKEIDVKLASGFEKQIFSFAYKYALGKLQNYNILMLDEVDSAASEENSKKFYETIAKMNNMFNQIFIITHKIETKNLLQNDYNAKIFEIFNGKIV